MSVPDPLLDFASLPNIQRVAAQSLNQPQLSFIPQTPAGYANPMPPMPGPLTPEPAPLFQAPYLPNKVRPNDLGLFANLIRQTESHHNYQAKNPTTSASGAYQYINKTWNNYGGYPEARLAPKAVQDAKFNEDAIGKLNKYAGDPFKMIADHMLPAQANKPWLWNKPSTVVIHGKIINIPPVATYVRKVIQGSPWAGQFDQYLKAQGGV